LVLADSLYGESGVNFIDTLYELKLRFAVSVVTIQFYYPKGRRLEAIDGENLNGFYWRNKEVRYIREIMVNAALNILASYY